jgi:hypothetical protein
MNGPIESIILCEGYHDRAFWAGWLKHRGCAPVLGTPKAKAKDPFGDPLAPSDFAFHTPAGAFLRVRPCKGDTRVLDQLRWQLEGRSTHALRHLIVNLDTDAEDEETVDSRASSLRQRIHSAVVKFDPNCQVLDAGDLVMDGGTLPVSIVLWSCDDAPTAHLPAKQTLERLVCASLCAAYPGRGAAVSNWLGSRPPCRGRR